MEEKNTESNENSDDLEIKVPQEPKFDELYSEVPKDPEELEKYLSTKVKLRWSRVLIIGLVIGVVLTLINLLVVWIISFYIVTIFLYLSWFLLIEMAILFIWGSCLGIMKQSFTIDRLRKRITKGEYITGADTKIAIGSAYTYIFAGIILGIASTISWAIVG